MRTNIFWAVLVIAMALVEAKWPYALRIQGVVPQLVLVLVVYFAITEGEERAMFTAVLGGIFKDVATGAVLGHHVLCMLIVGYVVGTLAKRLITDNPAVKTGAVFCASLGHSLIYLVVDYVQRADTSSISALLSATVPQAFYTALMTPVLFVLLSRTPMPQQRRAH